MGYLLSWTMEFRSYFQFSFRIIFRVCTTFVPRKKKNITSQKQTSQQAPKEVLFKNSKPPEGSVENACFRGSPGAQVLPVPRFFTMAQPRPCWCCFFWSQKVWVFRWHGFTPPKRGHECNCYISLWLCPFLLPYLYILLQSCRYTLLYIKYCYFNLHFTLFHQTFSPNLEAWVLSFQLTWTDKRLFRFASTTVTYDTTPTNLCISDFSWVMQSSFEKKRWSEYSGVMWMWYVFFQFPLEITLSFLFSWAW